MKTTQIEIQPRRNRTNGRSSLSARALRYRSHRRRSQRPARVPFDRIPQIVLPHMGFGLTAADIEADLFYGRD